MKKVFLFIAFSLIVLTAGKSVRAQYSQYYYHLEGDTIEWRSEIGYYDWWEFEPFYEDNLTVTLFKYPYPGPAGMGDSTAILQRFYTPAPLKIIGIAGAALRGRGNIAWIDSLFVPDTNMFQEYYLIYDSDSTGMTLKAQVPWSPFEYKRTLHIMVHRSGIGIDSCCFYNPREFFLPIHEYYFDSAFYVSDTFYVGGTFFGNRSSLICGIPSADSIHTGYYYANMGYVKYACNLKLQVEAAPPNTGCYPPGLCLKRRKEMPGTYFPPSHPRIPYDQREWEVWWDPAFGSMLIYPIVEVDTTVPPAGVCPPVANVQAVVEGTTATVTWDDCSNYQSFLLCYGLCEAPEEQWQTITIEGSAQYTLVGLDSGACYGVRLKAQCEKEDSPWSDTVFLYTPQDTTHVDTVGIGGPTALSQLTFLVPNPAKDEVTVSSSFNLREIDIWTVGGVWVHHQSASGHQVTVPIDFLRPGTYIVAIRTHDGTTHKKLLIQ